MTVPFLESADRQEMVLIPDLARLFDGFRGSPEKDALATALAYLILRGNRFPFGWERLQRLCGRRMALRVRHRLEELGVLSPLAQHWAGHHARLYACSIPKSAKFRWYPLRSKKGLERFRGWISEVLSFGVWTPEAEAQVETLRRCAQVPLSELFGGLVGSSNAHRAVLRAASGVWYPLQDSWGRLYTPFTFMPREYRLKVLLGNEPVAQVDVSNCFPLLCGALARRDGLHAEEFVTEAESGEVYDVLGLYTSEVRAVVKRGLNVWMNCERQVQALEEVLQLRYPSLCEWVVQKRGRFKALYYVLAPLESTIMLGAVSRLISAGIPAGSVHDCVFCPRSAIEETKNVIISQFQSIAGVTPTLTVDCSFE